MMANQVLFVSKGLATQGDAVDFEAIWAELSSSLREIHTKNASKLSFEELYRNAYKLVLKKKGETLYERVKLFEREWLGQEVRARINGVLSSTLLVGAGGATGNTTVNEKRVAGERFLRGLKQAWEDHNLCMNMTTDVLMYMVSLTASFHPWGDGTFAERFSDSCYFHLIGSGLLLRSSPAVDIHSVNGAVPGSDPKITSIITRKLHDC